LLQRDDCTGLATGAHDENVVFVHTGGQAGLLVYQPTFAA
jgi:hypothetical protein